MTKTIPANLCGIILPREDAAFVEDYSITEVVLSDALNEDAIFIVLKLTPGPIVSNLDTLDDFGCDLDCN